VSLGTTSRPRRRHCSHSVWPCLPARVAMTLPVQKFRSVSNSQLPELTCCAISNNCITRGLMSSLTYLSGFYAVRTVYFGMKLYNDQRNAQVSHLFIYLLPRLGSSVGIAIGYGLGGAGIEFRWGRYFPHLSRPALGPTQPPAFYCVHKNHH
jgi:hypothetical protein